MALAAFTALSVGVAAALLVADQRSNAGQEATREPFFPQLSRDPEAAAQVSVRQAGYDLVLRREEGRWLAETMGSYPVRPNAVERLVGGLAAMRAMEPKTDDPALYPAIAVEPPDQAEARSALIEVDGPDGAPLAEAVVGIRSASIGFNPLGGMFVRRPDEARAWLVEGSVDVPDEASAWFEPIVHVPGPDVRRVTIYDGAMMRFDAVKEAGEGSTYRLAHLADAFAKPGVEADDSAIKQMGLGIVSTQFDAAKRLSDIPFPVDARRIVFETKGGMVLQISLADADGKTWVAYRATAPEGSADVQRASDIRARTEGWAFLLPEHRLAPLRVKVEDLVRVPPAGQAPALQ